MPTDRARWNARYHSRPPGHAGPQPWLVEQQTWLPPTGLALDVAMGLGGSAGWLLGRGWRVAGADLADVAVRRAKARWPALLAWVADLEHLALPPATFDLILDFYYLDRGLWPMLRQALKPGGLFIMETFVYPPAGADPAINPAHRLQPGELRAAWAEGEVLVYREGERAGRWVASMVARAI